jgi:hypothetical protein
MEGTFCVSAATTVITPSGDVYVVYHEQGQRSAGSCKGE